MDWNERARKMTPAESISESKAKRMPNKEPSMLVRVVLILLPILVSVGIGFNVYSVKAMFAVEKRTQSLEDWRETQNAALATAAALNKTDREAADEAMRVRILREVETAASTQRENVLAQLSAIQRDVLRIAVILDLQGTKVAPSYKSNLEPGR